MSKQHISFIMYVLCSYFHEMFHSILLFMVNLRAFVTHVRIALNIDLSITQSQKLSGQTFRHLENKPFVDVMNSVDMKFRLHAP
jgi:hypothetical protein